MPIFAEAGSPALEQIARSAQERRYAPGDVIVAEGDAAVELFVVHDGEVVVSTSADGEVGRIGAGDWFGEIGVLRHVPRVASVTAATNVTVSAIPGSIFVDALSSSEGLPDPLVYKMNTHLLRTQPNLLTVGTTTREA